MIVDEIRARLRAQPFKPFILRMNDGRTFVVPDVGWMAMGGKGLTGVVAKPDGGPAFIDPSEAAAVEPLDPSAAINPDTLRAAIRARPFAPFRLRLADGRVFPIPHPEWLALAPNGSHAVVFTGESESVQLDRLLIVALEPSAPDVEY